MRSADAHGEFFFFQMQKFSTDHVRRKRRQNGPATPMLMLILMLLARGDGIM